MAIWNFASLLHFFPLSKIMSHCHQSSAMCHRVIILGGKGTHTGDCNARKPQTSHYLSRPVAKKTTKNQRVVATITVEKKKQEKLPTPNKQYRNKTLQTHLCRSQFREHRPHCRSEEPLRPSSLIVVRKTDHFTEMHNETFTTLA